MVAMSWGLLLSMWGSIPLHHTGGLSENQEGIFVQSIKLSLNKSFFLLNKRYFLRNNQQFIWKIAFILSLRIKH